MRRLIGRGRRERGAVAVVVALCMVVLMGFVAISVDVGSIYSDQQQLQNGADAGALAIAQSCLRDPTKCSDSANNDIADKYAQANKLDGQVDQVEVTMTTGSVTVEVYSTHQNWFAGVLFMPTTAIRARATATWEYLWGDTTLPLAFGECEFIDATGGWDINGEPLLKDTKVTVPLKEKTCSNAAHNEVPGGFGWLVTDPGTNCVATVQVGDWKDAKVGMPMPTPCDAAVWTAKHLVTVDVPIFDKYTATGSNGRYKIIGLAGFTITGYCFTEANWNFIGADLKTEKCNASNNGIQGYFTKYVASGPPPPDSTATNFGAFTVKLSG